MIPDYVFDMRPDRISVQLDPKSLNEKFDGLFDKFYENDCLSEIEIDRVLFNKPATIVWFADGTKVVAKCGKDDEWDMEKGLMVCLLKKLVGNKFNDVIKPYILLEALRIDLSEQLDKMCEGLTLDDDGKVVLE